MIGRVATLLCAAAMTIAVPAAAQTTPPPFSSLTVFGDSLVDAGNIRALRLGADPAQGYVAGRFTNGLDYTDLLSLAMYGTPTVASLNGGSNYAFGGARATSTTPVYDALEQVALYDLAVKSGKAVDPNGLYVLNFGGNDVFAAVEGASAGVTDPDAFLREAANNYVAAVAALNKLGARNILLTGFPVATEGAPLALSIKAEGYLTDALDAFKPAAGTRLMRYSYLDFFQRVQTNPAAFDLPVPLILPAAGQPGTTCRGANAFPACTGYFSFDGVHPTTAIHRALYNDINSKFGFGLAAVPEPTTWAMLILGFATIGAALRRDRRRRVAA
ncbi:MAG: SGNH/GDSL hydrolase family protein [Sphingomonas phyllosphaerae]